MAPPIYANPKPNFGMQCAKASWIAPIIAVVLNLITLQGNPNDQHGGVLTRTIIGFASLVIYAIGLVLGIMALTSIRRYGRRGIVGPAIVGVSINGALVVIFLLVIMIALARR